MGTDKYVVIHDAFELNIWDDFLREFEGMILDTHNDLMTADMMIFRERNVEVYSEYLQNLDAKVNATAKRLPLIVDEWNATRRMDWTA